MRLEEGFQNEIDLPAPLLLNFEPQPGVLLQRRPRDQVAMVQRGQEQVPRRSAQLRGLKGDATMLIPKIRVFPLVLVLFSLMLNLSGAKAQSDREESGADVAAPIEPLPPDIDESSLFSELLTHNELRNAALAGYTEQRTYQVTDLTGRVRAQEIGRMEYRAPDKKTFATTSESGSGLVRRLALNPLIASEIDAASGKQHHDSAITPENYTLVLLGEQQVG